MEPKKTKRASLENKKLIFFQVGLLSALILIIIAFEWTSTPDHDKIKVVYSEQLISAEEIKMPVTRRERSPDAPPPPPPPSYSDIFEIIENEEELMEALFVDDVEIPKKTQFSFSRKITLEEEEVEFKDDREGKLHFIVDQMPDFQGGGLEGFRLYISENTSYPSSVSRNIQGSVYVRFIVNENGTVSDVTVMRSLHPELDREAVSIVKSSPRWTPGIHQGMPVRVVLTFPVNFAGR